MSSRFRGSNEVSRHFFTGKEEEQAARLLHTALLTVCIIPPFSPVCNSFFQFFLKNVNFLIFIPFLALSSINFHNSFI